MGVNTEDLATNLLGITNPTELNAAELAGVQRVLDSLQDMEPLERFTPWDLQDLHRQAFGGLYTWAGEWRTSTPNAGPHVPPDPERVRMLMIEFCDNLTYQQGEVESDDAESVARLLAWAHHKLVWIHPFSNGNGRTARFLTDLLSYQNGWVPPVLYQRDPGEERTIYISAIRQADEYNFKPLEALIKQQLVRLS